MMGGSAAVQKAAADADAKGGLANWRWSLKLTSMLLGLDPHDAEGASSGPRRHASSVSAPHRPTRVAGI